MAPGLTELEVVPFRVAAYNKKTSKMEYYDPSNKEDYEFISGTCITNNSLFIVLLQALK